VIHGGQEGQDPRGRGGCLARGSRARLVPLLPPVEAVLPLDGGHPVGRAGGHRHGPAVPRAVPPRTGRAHGEAAGAGRRRGCAGGGARGVQLLPQGGRAAQKVLAGGAVGGDGRLPVRGRAGVVGDGVQGHPRRRNASGGEADRRVGARGQGVQVGGVGHRQLAAREPGAPAGLLPRPQRPALPRVRVHGQRVSGQVDLPAGAARRRRRRAVPDVAAAVPGGRGRGQGAGVPAPRLPRQGGAPGREAREHPPRRPPPRDALRLRAVHADGEGAEPGGDHGARHHGVPGPGVAPGRRRHGEVRRVQLRDGADGDARRAAEPAGRARAQRLPAVVLLPEAGRRQGAGGARGGGAGPAARLVRGGRGEREAAGPRGAVVRAGEARGAPDHGARGGDAGGQGRRERGAPAAVGHDRGGPARARPRADAPRRRRRPVRAPRVATGTELGGDGRVGGDEHGRIVRALLPVRAVAHVAVPRRNSVAIDRPFRTPPGCCKRTTQQWSGSSFMPS
jgi:hypothetical protein